MQSDLNDQEARKSPHVARGVQRRMSLKTMSLKTPTRSSKKCAVVDPLSFSSNQLKNLFSDRLDVGGDDQTVASELEDAAFLPQSNENFLVPEKQNPRTRSEGKTRTEDKRRNHHTTSRSSKDGDNHKKSHNNHPQLQSPVRHHHHDKHSDENEHHRHVGASSKSKPHGHANGKRIDQDVKTSPAHPKKILSKHKSLKASPPSRLREPSLSPERKKKKKVSRRPVSSDESSDDDDDDSSSSSSSNNNNNSSSSKLSSRDSGDNDNSTSDSSNNADSSDEQTVIQFDPLAGTVQVEQKKGKNGISEFSDPVGDAQRLNSKNTKKPVFSFLDSDGSDTEEEKKKRVSKTKKSERTSSSKHVVKEKTSKHVVKEKAHHVLSSKEEAIATKEKEKEKRKTTKRAKEGHVGKEEALKKEKKPKEPHFVKDDAKKSQDDMLSAYGFNSSTCHFCHKDVGPMIMQCMSCKETYFCQKCLRKGFVASHQQVCAQRKVDERELEKEKRHLRAQKSTTDLPGDMISESPRRHIKSHKSMPDVGKPSPSTDPERSKRRKPKSAENALSKDSERLFHKEPLMHEHTPAMEHDPYGAQHKQSMLESTGEGLTSSPTKKKLGIGKFFGFGKKNSDDADDEDNEGPGGYDTNTDDDCSVNSKSNRRPRFFRRPSIRDQHQLLDDDDISDSS